MKGALRPKRQLEGPSELEVPLKLPPIPDQDRERAPPLEGPLEDPREKTDIEPATEPEPTPVTPTTPSPQLIPPGRPSRTSRKPIKYQDYECYPCGVELGEEEQEKVKSNGTTGETTLADQAGLGPATSRPDMNLLGNQMIIEEGVGRDSEGERDQ